MGLDWVLKSKVLEGKEEEHAEARKKRLEARDKYYEQDALGADKLVLMELKETLDRLEDEENALEISPCGSCSRNSNTSLRARGSRASRCRTSPYPSPGSFSAQNA